MEKTLQEIREAETHVEKILIDAREKASLIVSKGKSDADAFTINRKKDILTEKTVALISRKKELEKEQQKFLKKAEKEAESLVERADERTKKTLSTLLKDFKTQLS
ncbi:MAG: hypothetical protein WC254_04885 [Candidatus Woesearchaeota archaeon]